MLVLAAWRRVAEVEKRRRRRWWWEDERRYKTASVAGLLGGKAGQRLRCFSQGEFGKSWCNVSSQDPGSENPDFCYLVNSQ